MEILGPNFSDVISKAVPPEFIPKCYGGEMDYNLTGGGSLKAYKKDLPKPTKILVPASDKHIRQLTLNEGVVVGWDFSTVGYDISFGLFFS